MTCDEAREAFTDLYDGTLSGPPLTALSQHLDGCRSCRSEWTAFRGALQALHDLRDEEPSPGFSSRVIERIEAPPWWRRAIEGMVLPLRIKLPIHAAALVLVGLIGIWVFQRTPELRRAADVRVPIPAERSASPQATPPAPAKTPVEPRAEAKSPGQPSSPPLKAAAPRAAAPSVAKKMLTPSAEPEGRSTAQLPSAAQGETPKTPAAPSGSLAEKAEIESAAPRLLQSAPSREGSGAKADSAPQVKSASPATGKEPPGPPPGTADELFSTAATEFAAQNYDGAVEHFRTFLMQHPKDRRAPDARFFLAEAYRAQGRYAQASVEYETFLGQYPDHRKAPDALYRQGETRLALGDAAGCRILRDALNRYPGIREAATARETLAAHCP